MRSRFLSSRSPLPDADFRRRHRGLLWLLASQLIALPIFARHPGLEYLVIVARLPAGGPLWHLRDPAPAGTNGTSIVLCLSAAELLSSAGLVVARPDRGALSLLRDGRSGRPVRGGVVVRDRVRVRDLAARADERVDAGPGVREHGRDAAPVAVRRHSRRVHRRPGPRQPRVLASQRSDPRS